MSLSSDIEIGKIFEFEKLHHKLLSNKQISLFLQANTRVKQRSWSPEDVSYTDFANPVSYPITLHSFSSFVPVLLVLNPQHYNRHCR